MFVQVLFGAKWSSRKVGIGDREVRMNYFYTIDKLE